MEGRVRVLKCRSRRRKLAVCLGRRLLVRRLLVLCQ